VSNSGWTILVIGQEDGLFQVVNIQLLALHSALGKYFVLQPQDLPSGHCYKISSLFYWGL
jgi:hypothetical protein